MLFVSKDFLKNRSHIHYLMLQDTPNSAHIVATFNSKKNTVTLKEEMYKVYPIIETFVKLALENENQDKDGSCDTKLSLD